MLLTSSTSDRIVMQAYSDDLVAHALPSDLQEGVVLLRKAGEVRAVLDVGNYFCSVPEEVQEIEDYFLVSLRRDLIVQNPSNSP